MKSLVVAAVLFIAGNASSHATTIDWWQAGGPNEFNDFTISFTPFKSDLLLDVKGSGVYEACCSNSLSSPTTFTLQLLLGGGAGVWTTVLTWTNKNTIGQGDEDPRPVTEVVPPQIALGPTWVSGIRLTSDPDGDPTADYNFTKFNTNSTGPVTASLEHTDFVFRDFTGDVPGPVPVSSEVPIPGALPLLGSGIALFGYLARRKRGMSIAA